MNRFLTVGLTVVAGAAVIEAALIPGLAVGAAAVLAPRYLRGLTRRLRAATATAARPAPPGWLTPGNPLRPPPRRDRSDRPASASARRSPRPSRSASSSPGST